MNEKRKEYLKIIDEYIIEERLNQVDQDYLEFEVKMASDLDLERIAFTLMSKEKFNSNPHNSILLYVTGLVNDFDFLKSRSDMQGGAPPDIDIDHDALDREEAIQWCVDYWGRDNVANIITHGTFKPKSLARSFYRIHEGNQEHLDELLKMFPPPKYGKEPTLAEVIEENPELPEDERYDSFLEFADRIEDMIANFGIHAAGVIISDFEIHEVAPLWKNSKADRITQYDKDECEELGLIKFDFLGIDTLSIIKECQKLIKENHNIEINPYSIEDGDKDTYKTLCNGYLTGVFQMETSGTAKRLILEVQPESVEDLSAISALNRPGPLQAGLDKQYIINKFNNAPPEDLPEAVADVLKASYWTLVYQEQVMEICSKIAGFTPKESDDIRRAMGKKKVSVLETYKEQFINGCQDIGGLAKDYAEGLWDNLLGFADYCLAGNTIVKTSSENTSIQDIVTNQTKSSVLSFDLQNQKQYYQHVTQWHTKGIKDTFTYTFEDGSEVTCTEDHKFLSDRNLMLPIDSMFLKNISLKKVNYGDSWRK